MRHALALAARGRGFVEPNPMVGAVVLDSAGNLVGEGWHQRFGGPHAEVFALQAAGEKARDGTLIVTLEPCCHHGKTPPCTDAVLKAGVSRVVVAMADPFPRVAGGGLKILRDAGVEVQVGVCAAEAHKLNAPYLKLLHTDRPWVHLKWAMTLDGKIATRTSDSKWISGEESRRRVHELRGRVDAVIVGRGTVVADDPLLTARPAGPRVAARVVVTASGDLPERCQLRESVREGLVLIYTAMGNEGKFAGWRADGAEVVALPANDNRLSLDAVLADLGKRRFTNVLVEGGAGLLGSFLDAKAADEFHVFIAPKIVGGDSALSPVAGRGVKLMADAFELAECTFEPSGRDVYVHGLAK
ncbi:MAG: bifunctional diaminohydroxyphosphoribosylaminopyrimidine deaminase/5-amino-6-(5-phosphoribosylamino)uracil reductase RibD [Planctomycetes bacterium]|nr:bifunctional diaminohydroxyphosphoribosylaminopyrimidine deaminase/5-amino-6-(5-phosphoribosylamino)uracil reductase RibD [Planctomycetota bacterium]